jgi:hypothetical protein
MLENLYIELETSLGYLHVSGCAFFVKSNLLCLFSTEIKKK